MAEMPDGTVTKLEPFTGVAAGTYVHVDILPDSGDVILTKGEIRGIFYEVPHIF